jgi:hypothetical protein
MKDRRPAGMPVFFQPAPLGSTFLAMMTRITVSTPEATVIQRMLLMRKLKSPSMP